MRLVRSDSPEVARGIASAKVRAARYLNDLLIGITVNVVGAFVVLAIANGDSLSRAARIGVPVLLAVNTFLYFRARSVRRNWVTAICAERMYIRLYVDLAKNAKEIGAPDVIVFETSDLASVSIRTVEVLRPSPHKRRGGPLEWLVIEPSQAPSAAVSGQLRSLLGEVSSCDLGKQALVTYKGTVFTIEWKLYRPPLRSFIREVARALPSTVIAPEQRSELDLRTIWHKPESHQRQTLTEAKRLGLGAACVLFVARCKHMSLSEARAYMATVEHLTDDAHGE